MSDHSSFLAIIQNSEAVSARWSDLVQKTISDARDLHGVTLEPDDILNIREVRLAAMGAELDSEAYQNELLNLPQLSKAAQRRAIEAGDADARAAAVADVSRGKDNVHHSHRTAHAARTLSEARELGIATPPPEHDERSRNERLEAIKEISDPAERLSLARRWELI